MRIPDKMAGLETFDVVEDTGRQKETSAKVKTAEQDQRERRNIAHERTGKPRHKQVAAYNPHHYPQYTDHQGFYPSQGGGRYKDHRFASHDHWRWRTDQQWTNGTDMYADGDYPSYHYRGSKCNRKTANAVDSRPDNRRDGKKSVSEQSLSEGKGSSLASGRDKQKATVVRHVEKPSTETNSTDEKVVTTDGGDSQKIENSADKDKNTIVKSTGKYCVKKSGYKSVPNTRKYRETTDSTVTHPSTVKRKQPESKIKVSSSTHKERSEKNEVENKKIEDRGKGVGDKDAPVHVPGKYHVKKSTYKSATDTTNVADTEILPDSTNIPSHGKKKRDYKGKHFRSVKQYGGVASSMQSDVLSQQLFSGQYECMVCCDRIRVNNPVWSCSTCYHIFHLKCIKKWAKIPTDLENGKVCLFVLYVYTYS